MNAEEEMISTIAPQSSARVEDHDHFAPWIDAVFLQRLHKPLAVGVLAKEFAFFVDNRITAPMRFALSESSSR